MKVSTGRMSQIFVEPINTQENESKELEFLKCTQSVVTKPYPSRDELETAVGLKTHTCLHLSMVRIAVVAQSNWTHSESHTRTQHSVGTGRCVPDRSQRCSQLSLSRASRLFQRSRVNIIGVRGRVSHHSYKWKK